MNFEQFLNESVLTEDVDVINETIKFDKSAGLVAKNQGRKFGETLLDENGDEVKGSKILVVTSLFVLSYEDGSMFTLKKWSKTADVVDMFKMTNPAAQLLKKAL